MSAIFVLFFVVVFLSSAPDFIACRPDYINKIPNGRNVPNPCDYSLKWQAVGHESPDDGNAGLNAFGRDFNAENQQWTRRLCQMDSDGDGRTNGEELGDPQCVWRERSVPVRTTGITHPGVCEPIDSAKCLKNNAFLSQVVKCNLGNNRNGNQNRPQPINGVSQQGRRTSTTVATPNRRINNNQFDYSEAATSSDTDADTWCQGLSRSDVRNVTLTLRPAFDLPSQETTYMCQDMTLPNDKDYHIIAWQPIVTNKELVQQIILYVCDKPNELEVLTRKSGYRTPAACPVTPACTSVGIIWSAGIINRCLDPSNGIPFGRNYYRTVILQVAYDNPNSREATSESSGIRIFYVPRRRSNDQGLIAIGQEAIAIPPQALSTSVFGKTFGSSDCSADRFQPYGSFYITSIVLRMHRLGNYARVVLKKADGQTVTLLDQPVVYERQPVLKWSNSEARLVEPGDNFEIECRYNSQQRNTWTYFGSSFRDEACFAYLEIYPRPQEQMFQQLVNVGDIDFCERNYGQVGRCNTDEFYATLQSISDISDDSKDGFSNSCSCSAYPARSCSRSCYDYLKRNNLLGNPCFTERNGSAFYVATRYSSDIFLSSNEPYAVQSQASKCSGLTSQPPATTRCDVGAEQPQPQSQSNSNTQSQSIRAGAMAPSYSTATVIAATLIFSLVTVVTTVFYF